MELRGGEYYDQAERHVKIIRDHDRVTGWLTCSGEQSY